MSGELAIHHLGGGLGLGPNAFGRDVANLALYRAFARHGGFERLHMLTSVETDAGSMAPARAVAMLPASVSTEVSMCRRSKPPWRAKAR